VHTIDAESTRNALPFARLIPALRAAFAATATVPDRHHHGVGEGQDATLLLMPAWDDDYLGVKLVNVFPRNAHVGRPALSSTFLLASARTGEFLALIDGGEITRRRTVAASAVAAGYLARPESRRHLVVGAGSVGSLVVDAYREVLQISRVDVYDAHAGQSAGLVERLRAQGVDAYVVSDLRSAVEVADVITCATLATEPVVLGEWLSPGVHLDLIGSFTPTMREVDDAAIRRSSIFIDTPSALYESGDLSTPIADGVLTPADVRGDLADLCGGRVSGRSDSAEITLFKSVGTALEDLAAARLAYEQESAEKPDRDHQSSSAPNHEGVAP
jgi:ornithine cyclodeaminase/alanine dehydrogenase-like protein (mu-crystallin family)